MYNICYSNNKYLPMDDKIDAIFEQCIHDIKKAYVPLKEFFKKEADAKIVDYIIDIIADENFKDRNDTLEYRHILTYILFAVSNDACYLFNESVCEDLEDYSDRYGRVEMALNYIMASEPTFNELVVVYSEQIWSNAGDMFRKTN